MIALATLPKLQLLSLQNMSSITGQIFEHFSTLKAIGCSSIKDIGQGICHLIRGCKDIEFIVFSDYSDDDIIDMFKCLCKSLKYRTNCNSLFVDVIECCAQITPTPSRDNPSEKYYFQIYKSKEDCQDDAPYFECRDEESFLNKISSSMEWFRNVEKKFSLYCQ